VLHAQDAPYRTQLKELCKALDSAASVARVELIKARWDAPTGNPVERLGDAYAELRLGALTSDRDYLTTAWEHFDQTVRVHPDWPYARLGLAMAALEFYSRRYPVPAMYDDVVGGTHYDGYVIQMKRLLKEEPTFEPAITWLAETLGAEGDREQPGPVLSLLQYAVDSAGVTDPGIQLILARAERLKGNAVRSVHRIDAYLREGGDSGVGGLDIARSFAWMGELESGATEYLAGAQVRTVEARATYRLDLSWVATPRELARFDSLPADSVGAWIGHFWSKRDVQELRPDGSRLPEHLRRWVYVNQRFRVPDPGRRTAWKTAYMPWTGMETRPQCMEDGAYTLDDLDYSEPARQGGYRAPERVFDHRAIVYMRHGEPMLKFGGSPDSLSYGPPTPTQIGGRESSLRDIFWQPDATRSVTWVYLMGGQLRVFTFMGHLALGRNSPSTMILYRPPSLDVLQQLAALASSYARLAGSTQVNAFNGNRRLSGDCDRWYQDVVRQQRSDAAVAVTTDTYVRRFSKPLTAALQFSAIGQPTAGTGKLLAVLAMRASELAAEPVEGDSSAVRFAVNIQMAAIDSMTGEAVQIDTVRHFVTTRQLVREGAWISFAAILPLKPRLREVHLAVSQEDDRGSIFSGPIDPAGNGFSASDIVLGGETASVPWQRNGATVMASAFSTYTVGDAVQLYYELYGLKTGGEYRTKLSLRRTGDTKFASTLTFTDRAAGPTLASNRSLALNDAKPGQYELVITVEEVATKRRVVRQRAISVEKVSVPDTR
jgi:hypothetical protein